MRPLTAASVHQFRSPVGVRLVALVTKVESGNKWATHTAMATQAVMATC
jgi:hypothetical protein